MGRLLQRLNLKKSGNPEYSHFRVNMLSRLDPEQFVFWIIYVPCSAGAVPYSVPGTCVSSVLGLSSHQPSGHMTLETSRQILVCFSG